MGYPRGLVGSQSRSKDRRKILAYVAFKATHHAGADFLIAPDNITKLLGVQLLREGGGTLKVAEHERQLATLSLRRSGS